MAELLQRLGVTVQEAQPVGVKGRYLKPLQVAVQYRLGAALHLTRRLIGKGKRENAPGADMPLLYKVGDLRRKHLRLAAARAREHDLRPVAIGNGLALARVERFYHFTNHEPHVLNKI